MLSIIKSMCLYGLEGVLIHVEVDVSNGFPCWDVVGLPDANIKESKERVKTALKNSGVKLESRKYIINLSPATIRKRGGYYDLSIAVGIVISIGMIKNRNINEITKETVFVGELSLDGKINKINGTIAICIEAKKNGIKRIVIPKENFEEANSISGIEIIALDNLEEVINFLNTGKYDRCTLMINQEKRVIRRKDYSEVIGQKNVIRALEIVAAGGHNCLLIGNPGCGKTMMVERIKTILPEPTLEESIEITKIQSIKGLTNDKGIIKERPFRNPHHSVTMSGLIGGGKYPMPGEISLAHLGVLFLDEMLEFDSNVLNSLRLPVEEKKICITRNELNITYPASFILIGSTNPCPCGYYGSKERECKCTEKQRKKYLGKISGPLMDRFDLRVIVKSIDYSNVKMRNEPSNVIKKRVENARTIQNKRFYNSGFYSNGDLDEKGIDEFCILSTEAESILNKGAERLKFSMRAYSKIKKVARTIADLEGEKIVQKKHILEAMQYRKEL